LLTLPAVFLFYAVAGAISGTIVGLVGPVGKRSRRGAMLVGVLATLPVYFGAVAAVRGFKALADVPGDVGLLTKFSFDERGRLVLYRDGERSRFVRVK
jgi:hypothetical protein